MFEDKRTALRQVPVALAILVPLYVTALLLGAPAAAAVPLLAVLFAAVVLLAAAYPQIMLSGAVAATGAAALSLSTLGVDLGVHVYALDPIIFVLLAAAVVREMLFDDFASETWPLRARFLLYLSYLAVSAIHGYLAGNDARILLGDVRRMGLYPLVLVPFCAALDSQDDVAILLRGVLLGAVACAGIEFYRIANGIGYHDLQLEGQTIRYLSYLEATTAAVAALVAVGYARMRAGVRAAPWLVAAGFFSLVVLFSNYRTMWLALLVGLVVQAGALGWRRAIRTLLVATCAFIPILYVVVAFTPLGSAVVDRFNALNLATSGVWRYFSWLTAARAWFAHPWLGTGLGYKHEFEYRNVESGTFVAATENTIHNDPLWYLVNNGVIGVVVLALFAWPWLKRAVRLAESENSFARFTSSTSLGSLALMLVVSMLQPFFSIGATAVLTCLFLAIVIRAPYAERSHA